MRPRVKELLREIVGEENFTDSLIDLIAYSKDASEFKHRPDAALCPVNRDQISAILKLANKEKLPVIARGAGTSLAGLAVPQEGGLILDLYFVNSLIPTTRKRMPAIRERPMGVLGTPRKPI